MASSVAMAMLLVMASAVTASSSTLKVDQGMSLNARPVQKVVKLLNDMRGELEKELEDDKSVHETLGCWCTSNEKEKTEAISSAQMTISQTEGTLGEAKAKRSQIASQRKELKDDLDKDQAALVEASNLRMKENQEFHNNEVDLNGAISACNGALLVLKKHNTDLAQVKAVASQLEKAQVAELSIKSGRDGHYGVPQLKDFLQSALVQTDQTGMEAGSNFLAVATPGFENYASQSGAIYGVLGQMKEDFQADLAAAKEGEAKSVEQFESMQSVKKEQVATAKKMVVALDTQLGDLGAKINQQTQLLDDTNEQLELDQKFMVNLKEKCSMTEEEFQQRVNDRLTEIKAVEDTIQVLGNEDSVDVFARSLNGAASFLQIEEASSATMQMRRTQAVNVLAAAAKKTKSVKLELLMMSASLDGFSKVQAQIAKVVGELQTQQQDESDDRDSCTDAFNKNERQTAEANDKKSNQETEAEDLQSTIDTITSDIEEANKAAAESQKQMKRRSESREADNADFQKTMSDQRLTQMILDKALSRMQQVYAFVQTRGKAKGAQTPPAKFKEYGQNQGGARVLKMIQGIIADSKKMTNDAITAEEDDQSGYEEFMKNSNTGLVMLAEKITHLSEAKAKAQGELSAVKQDLQESGESLDNLQGTLTDLHTSCDFLMKNYDMRQDARTEEIEAMNKAKNILAGMH